MSDMISKRVEWDVLGGLEVAEPDCVAENFDDEVIVLNSASGVYYSLTDLAAGVWRDLMAGHSVHSLLNAVNRVDERVSQEMIDFIRDLETAGLLRQTSLQASSALTPESVGLVSAGETRLTIQSFEDMKDLILADPIHDVDDEVGWPVLQRSDDG
jgi:hypothetical protein